ncbi:MAG TPA: glycosyltransferase family 4 protein [Gemmatimonadaceae bacterium]|nr:glycosyltransferase family 4 protein [Gemmatimonadaceae bacterium]
MSLRVSRVLEQLASTWPIVLICPPGGESAQANGVELIAEVNFPNVEQWMYVPSQYDIEPVVKKVRETVQTFEPAIALLWGGMEYLRDHIPEMPPSVSDRVDSMTLSAWRMLLRSPDMHELQSRLAHLAYVARYEFTTRKSSRAMAVVGDADASVLRRFLRVKNVHVIPNGVDATPHVGDRSRYPTVMFTGVLNYTPNVDAVLYFAETVWPFVHARIPEAVLQLVGRSPAPEIIALGSRPGIEVHANVESVPAMLAKAWVAVAPMRSGCGIKNKILEAWSVGTPAVMTPIATNGLTQAPEALLLTAEGEAMASMIVDLLNNPEKRDALGSIARATATDRFSWQTAGAAVSALLNNALHSESAVAV